MPSESSYPVTPSHATLVLAVGQRKYLSHIPHQLLSQAELCWRHSTPTLTENRELEDLEIFSSFLSGVLHHNSEYVSKDAKLALLAWGLAHFDDRFLGGSDIHVVTRSFKSQADIVATYFGVIAYLQSNHAFTRYVLRHIR